MNFKVLAFFCVYLYFTNTFLTAQTKDLDVFFTKYKTKFLKNQKITNIADDKANGYLQVAVGEITKEEQTIFGNIYTFAVWKTKSGKAIFGVFNHTSFSGGEYGESIKDLKFYDAQFNDITKTMYDFNTVKTLHAKATLKDMTGVPVEVKNISERKFLAFIPKKGTTIECLVVAVDASVFGSCYFVDLVFDKVKGTFKVEKKF